MDFESRRQFALEELSRTTMKTRDCLPPVHRALWRIGVNVRPPHYSSFFSIVAGITFWFGLLWSMVLRYVNPSETPLVQLFVSSASIGSLLGFLLASYYRYGARKHNLSRWKKLGEE